MWQNVIGFNPINECRIKGTFCNYSIISCHAPTENSSEEEFYDTLEAAHDACPKSDIKILAVYFNAKIDQENIYYPTIRPHEECNDNGQRTVNFAASQNLVVGTTLYHGCRIHKPSPYLKTFNQIDHLLISARHRSNLLSVRTFTGANIDADHYLVIA
ncbi:craniofacial development protein 2-like [Halyomorpha halys]|uniref:craniofacial development protein 2-like n=1 Tax=Halyomorpha halys TaxID=286706 RepID=UPI0034D32622